MAKRNIRLKLQLRCPICNSTSVQTRLKTKERVCRRCGHVGPYKDFEVKSESK